MWNAVLKAFEATPVGRQLVEHARDRAPFRLGGVRSSARALVLAVLARHRRPPLLWITSTEDEAERLVQDANFFLDAKEGEPYALTFPERQLSVFDEGTSDPDRLKVLEALLDGAPVVAVSPIVAVMQRTARPDDVQREVLALHRGDEVDMDALLKALVERGYDRTSMVEHQGQFSRRGGILDVYPATGDPVRVEFFGDAVDSIRTFNLDTQLSIDRIEKFTVLPMKETARSAFLTAYLPADAPVVLDEPSRMQLRLDEMMADASNPPPNLTADSSSLYSERKGPSLSLAATGAWHSKGAEVAGVWSDALELLGSHPRVEVTGWGATEEQVDVFLSTEAVPGFASRVEEFAEYAIEQASAGLMVIVVTHQAPRLHHILQRAQHVEDGPRKNARTDLLSDTPGAGRITVLHGQLLEGFKTEGLCLVTDREILGVTRRQRYQTASERGSTLKIEDLKVGDVVVHVSHGLGRFDGLTTLDILGSSRDFLRIAYAGGDNVFVPVEQMQNVAKYVGLDGDRAPSLSKLGRAEWQKTRQRVAEQVKEMADQLLRLYADRKAHPGFQFSPDGPWMEDLEAAFPYDETPDQDKAIEAVKADMESRLPMDRLVCGDVGYGKTEVAVRAAFKAALDNRQVALLVPTTILAQQHLNTFQERMQPFPIKVDMLSRFRTPREQREVVEGVNLGSVDVVIGTHRILQKDVKFKNLGLVIVDEEQHFGVEHKERLKELRSQVDVLTLTATPIPRTLQMSLVGVRDLSLIETPPEARLPIKTYLFESGPEVIRGALTRELDRGGQIFFIHNRVHGIEKVAADIRRLVPQARVVVGHGQMSEGSLEKVIHDFLAGEYDILVCTTIIESGVDMPNVNTIVIHNAHMFGLGQLYQLRGRVGRSTTQAYCYLLYPPQRALTQDAEKRLETIRDFTALGSGYQIAMRDLEIRGAGNLLGGEQSGHIAAVGFSLYCQMLEEAVAEARGRKPRSLEAASPTLELPVEAFIPDDFVPDARQKLTLYRRLAEATETSQLEAIAEEIRDRFGKLPASVDNLMRFVELKVTAVKLGVPSVKYRESFGDRAIVCLLPFVKEMNKRQLQRVGEIAQARAAFKDHQLVLTGFGSGTVDWVDAVLRALEWIGKHVMNPEVEKT